MIEGASRRRRDAGPVRAASARVFGVLLPLLLTLAPAAASAQLAERFEQDARSPRASTRIEAIRTIVASRHAQAAQLVAPLLKDADDRVQLEAIDGLLTLYLAPAPSDRQAVPFALRNGSVAESVFDAAPLSVLPRTVPEDVLTGLETAISDDASRVRVSAAYALGVLASPAVGPLPAEAAKDLAGRLVYVLRHDDPLTREAVVRACGRLYDEPLGRSGAVIVGDALIAAMNDADERVRVRAAEALGRLRYERAVQALTDRLEHLRRGSEAASALHALARIGHASSARVMRGHLTDRREPFRVMALEGLGRIGDRQAIGTITSALAGTRSAPVLLAGAFALHRLGQARNVEIIVDALARPSTIRQAQAYLTELGAPVASMLHPWLRDENPAMRQAVAEVLGLTGDPGSEEALRAATGDADRAVAEAARQALMRLRAIPGGVRIH